VCGFCTNTGGGAGAGGVGSRYDGENRANRKKIFRSRLVRERYDGADSAFGTGNLHQERQTGRGAQVRSSYHGYLIVCLQCGAVGCSVLQCAAVNRCVL